MRRSEAGRTATLAAGKMRERRLVSISQEEADPRYKNAASYYRNRATPRASVPLISLTFASPNRARVSVADKVPASFRDNEEKVRAALESTVLFLFSFAAFVGIINHSSERYC